jgi:hypothetical protein
MVVVEQELLSVQPNLVVLVVVDLLVLQGQQTEEVAVVLHQDLHTNLVVVMVVVE